jgi:allantoin racemase
VLINSFADYGIDALRAVLDIPVIGAGEATLLAAARAGRRFAIVTVWPRSMQFLYDERLRAVAVAEQCVAIRHFTMEDELARLGQETGVMARMHRGETEVIDGLRAECARAVREDGAECIVLGCTCMGPIGPALEASCEVPVLESSRVGLRSPNHADAAARERRLTRHAAVTSFRSWWMPGSRGARGPLPRRRRGTVRSASI